MQAEDSKKSFLENAHKSSGLPLEQLSEVYDAAYKSADTNPSVVAKSSVYKHIAESDVVTESKYDMPEHFEDGHNSWYESAFEEVFYEKLGALDNDDFWKVSQYVEKKYVSSDDDLYSGRERAKHREGQDVVFHEEDGEGGSWGFNVEKVMQIAQKMFPDQLGDDIDEDANSNARMYKAAKDQFDDAIKKGLTSKDLADLARYYDKPGTSETGLDSDRYAMAAKMMKNHERKFNLDGSRSTRRNPNRRSFKDHLAGRR